jgi:hypothetical protein
MQDGPVILVGHSWGGAVISEVGDDPQKLDCPREATFPHSTEWTTQRCPLPSSGTPLASTPLMPTQEQSPLVGLDELKARAGDARIEALELLRRTEQVIRESQELCERTRQEAQTPIRWKHR